MAARAPAVQVLLGDHVVRVLIASRYFHFLRSKAPRGGPSRSSEPAIRAFRRTPANPRASDFAVDLTNTRPMGSEIGVCRIGQDVGEEFLGVADKFALKRSNQSNVNHEDRGLIGASMSSNRAEISGRRKRRNATEDLSVTLNEVRPDSAEFDSDAGDSCRAECRASRYPLILRPPLRAFRRARHRVLNPSAPISAHPPPQDVARLHVFRCCPGGSDRIHEHACPSSPVRKRR